MFAFTRTDPTPHSPKLRQNACLDFPRGLDDTIAVKNAQMEALKAVGSTVKYTDMLKRSIFMRTEFLPTRNFEVVMAQRLAGVNTASLINAAQHPRTRRPSRCLSCTLN